MAITAPELAVRHEPKIASIDVDGELLRVPMSYEEFLELPDDLWAEWVRGVAIIDMTPTFLPHGTLVAQFAALLVTQFPDLQVTSDSGLLGEEWLRRPDVMVIEPQAQGVEVVEDIPIVAVEVQKHSTRRQDLVDKAQEYLDKGILQYWTVDTDAKTVTIRENNDADWCVLATISERTPNVTIQVGDYGMVTLNYAEIFRWQL